MTEQEILDALEAARQIDHRVWRIELSLNEEGCDASFYNSTLLHRTCYANGEGEDIRSAIADALTELDWMSK